MESGSNRVRGAAIGLFLGATVGLTALISIPVPSLVPGPLRSFLPGSGQLEGDPVVVPVGGVGVGLVPGPLVQGTGTIAVSSFNSTGSFQALLGGSSGGEPGGIPGDGTGLGRPRVGPLGPTTLRGLPRRDGDDPLDPATAGRSGPGRPDADGDGDGDGDIGKGGPAGGHGSGDGRHKARSHRRHPKHR